MKLLFTIAVSFFIAVAAFSQQVADLLLSPEASFVVNHTGDTNDANTLDNICSDASGNCTLRAAIQQANALPGNDLISFALAAPTINLSSELSVSQSLTITGPGARNLTVQRASSAGVSRVFNIQGVFGTTVVNISGITVANGSMGSEFGGGIRNAPGNTLNLSEVTVRDNTAEVGAGILNYGTLNIVNSTISNNIANSEGGGIHNQSIGTANLANTTVSGNSATNFGGGIISFNLLSLNNVTVSNNTVNRYGGGVYSNTPNIFVRNTIIANNSGLLGGADVYNSFTSLGNNLIGKNNNSNFPASTPPGTAQANGDKVGTSAVPINAMLGGLQHNGGQTDTQELSASSPAVDAGNNCVVTGSCVGNSPSALSYDQRGTGYSRQTDGSNDGTPAVDIGAFEAAGSVACSCSLGSTGQSFSGSGGNGSTTVTTGSTCSWNAQSNNQWIGITSGSGTGNGMIQFTVLANSGAARTGTITVAGQTLTVNQAAILSYEGDVTLRPTGDGNILSDDVVQIRKFLNGTNTPDTSTNEFQRADASPFNTLGDGRIFSDDVVQARRYQNGINPKQPAGGPMTPIAARTSDMVDSLFDTLSKTVVENVMNGVQRQVRVENASVGAGQNVTVNIRVDAQGDESEYGFILSYDQTKLSNPTVGAGTAGASVRSCNIATVGQINCSVGGFPNNNALSSETGIGEIAVGVNQLLITVTFTVAANAAPGDTPLSLSNVNASSDAPQLFFPTATGGAVTILAPTAASVSISGRVLQANGVGIANARVEMTDQNGNVRWTRSSVFGYYRLESVAAGEMYVISVRHKWYEFGGQAHLILDERDDINFIASP